MRIWRRGAESNDNFGVRSIWGERAVIVDSHPHRVLTRTAAGSVAAYQNQPSGHGEPEGEKEKSKFRVKDFQPVICRPYEQQVPSNPLSRLSKFPYAECK